MQPTRLQNELRIFKEKNFPFVKGPPTLVSDSLNNWEVSLLGPENSPYAGGIFKVSLTLTAEYPHQAPTVRFITPIYHPNVSQRDGEKKAGEICLTRLMKGEWNGQSMRLHQVISNLYELLKLPDLAEPIEPVIGIEYSSALAEFTKKAKELTVKSARP